VRVDLADQEDLVAAPGDRLADDLLGAALAVHLGGVDQRHAAFDAAAQRGDGIGVAVATLAEPQVPWPRTGIFWPELKVMVRIARLRRARLICLAGTISVTLRDNRLLRNAVPTGGTP